MVHALIKVSHRQIFQDSEVDVGLRVKGGNTIRVGKLVLELPLMIKPKHQERLMPYTSYITAGMWLQGMLCEVHEHLTTLKGPLLSGPE